jgi:uncharacterized protein (DUF1501 family)
MFEFGIGRQSRNCAGMNRRDFVRVGALGALTLPSLLGAEAQAAAAGASAKDMNVILIWLDGGPSHIDMFDPKPEAPAEIRGEFGAIETNVKGIRISDQLPNLAKQTDKYSILRITSPDSSHGTGNHYFLTGWKFTPAMTYPAFGSVYAREKGFRNGMPPYAIVGGVGQYTGGGYLGAVHNPFNVGGDPNADGFSVKDVTPPGAVNMDRVARRRGVLDAVDQFQRDAELSQRSVQAVNQFYSRAFDLVTSPVAKKAFSIKEEDAKLRDTYGRNSFGQGCLLARRLIEAGTRFVHIQKAGWDTHTSNFETLKKHRLPELDQGYAALLADLADRGMLSNTIVLCAGEFGRTPKVNSSAGRDHWGPASFATIGGGPIKMGIAVGETDAIAEYPADRPVTVEDMAATLWKAIGVNGEAMLESNDGRPVRVADGGTEISELL